MRPKKLPGVGILFAWTFVLAGCSALPSQYPATEAAKPAPNSVKPTPKADMASANVSGEESIELPPVSLTPLTTYSDDWIGYSSEAENFPNAYTRLLIYSNLPSSNDKESKGNIKQLPYTQRPWLLRALVGEEFSLNFSVKVSVGSYESTVPLATIGHQSNSGGERWNRVIHHTKSNFPLFLVRQDGNASIPTLKISVDGTRSYASRGAAAAMQVALGVAKATDQSASVITKLTEQTTKDKARAIDDAISKLFSSGILEEHWTDRDLRFWRTLGHVKWPGGVTVKFRIPSDLNNWNSTPQDVGAWTITFDYPRPSIFSDWRICAANTIARCGGSKEETKRKVIQEVRASEVLRYELVKVSNQLGTIGSYISRQDWYIAALTALVDSNAANAVATSLCRRIRNEIVGLDLNNFDAQFVAWAVAHGMPLPTGISQFPVVEDCKKPT